MSDGALARERVPACRARRARMSSTRRKSCWRSSMRDLEDRRARPRRRCSRGSPRGAKTLAWISVARRRAAGAGARCSLDDLRVAAQVAGGGDRAGERVDRRRAAGLGRACPRCLQLLGDGERVDRLASRRRASSIAAKIARWRLAVEVLGLQALLDDERVERPVGEQDRAEHRLLGLDGCAGGAARRAARPVPAVEGRAPWRPSKLVRPASRSYATGSRRLDGLRAQVRRVRRTSASLFARRASRRLLLLDDHRLDGRRDAVLDLDDDHVGPDVLDRLLEVDLAAVDLDAAGVLDRVGDVLVGDRAEQATVVAGLLLDREDRLGEQLGVLLRARLRASLLRRARRPRCALRGGVERALRRRLGELARDQVVAQVARGDVDDGARSPSDSTS